MTWWDEAACRGKPQSVFFPIASGGSYKARNSDPYAPARTICAQCPVRQPCLEYALALGRAGEDVHGCWAGTNDRERRALLGRTRERRTA